MLFHDSVGRLVVQMTIVQVVDVAFMLDRGVPAAGPVFVVVIFVGVRVTHDLNSLWCETNRLTRFDWKQVETFGFQADGLCVRTAVLQSGRLFAVGLRMPGMSSTACDSPVMTSWAMCSSRRA